MSTTGQSTTGHLGISGGVTMNFFARDCFRLAGISMALAACSGNEPAGGRLSSGGSAEDAGLTGSGGIVGTAGTLATGGTQASGGTRDTPSLGGDVQPAGGMTAAGGSAGALSTGGLLVTGGLVASGGNPESGGTTAAGGVATAGGTTGGITAAGGSTGRGGSTTTGGSAGKGGTTGTPASSKGGAGGTISTGGASGGNAPDGGASPPGALAATPPMGWISWNKFGGGITDTLVRGIADAMVSSGMQAAGYQYINIDDMWQASSRDTSGNIAPSSSKFPNGMKALADYVHSKGLKLGLYSDRGTKTCAGLPGSYSYESKDAQTYAAWGVDYLKYDNCSPAAGSNMQTDYTNMATALKATGRPIVFSVCAWWFYNWETSIGQLWRTGTDIVDTWDGGTDKTQQSHSFISLLNNNGGWSGRYTGASYASPGLAQYAGPGHWNDPDMLEVGNGGMTDTEYQSHFSLWAIMAAPLIAGNDVRSMTAATKNILTNADVIAVDQDPLGVQGKPISTSTTLEVWSKKLSGDQSYAVVLFNRTTASADITVTWASLGITSSSATVRDLWTHTDLGPTPTQYQATVPSHGVVMLKVAGG